MISGVLRMVTPAFPQAGGYAVCKVECRCGKTELRVSKNGDTYCRYCGIVIRPKPVTDVFRSVDELSEYLGAGNSEDDSDALRDRIS